MAVSTDDIAGYAKYLKGQGVPDNQIEGYTKYVAAQHEVDHPSESNKSWLDTEMLGGTPRGYIQGALNTLPTVGMVGGGIAGAETGPGAIGTAAMGAAGGEALKNLGEKYILGQNKSRAEIYGNPIKGATEGAAAEMGGQIVGKSLEAASETGPAKWVSDKVGGAGKWLASNLSGVPKKEIEDYASNPAEIEGIVEKAGGDPQEMADQFRNRTNEKIQSTKQALNDQISQTLAKRSDQTIDAQPILDEIAKSKARINAKLRPDEVAQVDDLMGKVNAVSTDGKIGLQDAHDLKEYLQEQSKASYSKNGQIFQLGSKAQDAAKSGAALTRQAVNEAAPEVAQANKTLSDLHDIDNTIGSNLLSEGKTSSPVFTAGSGVNTSNAKSLRRLSEITGVDHLADAQKVAAARTFGNPSLTPTDSTGKTVARMGAAGLLGGVTGYLADGKEGAVVGALAAEGLASPAVIKAAIDSGISVKSLASAAAKPVAPLAGKVMENVLKPAAETMSPAAAQPQKGPSKWASDGYANLNDHVSGTKDQALIQSAKDKLMSTTKGKDLLIAASDLKPGSKAMENLLEKIKNQIGQGR